MDQGPSAPSGATSPETIIARIERLPISGWYVRIAGIIGTAGLFDAFDAFAIAFVLPVLVEIWHLTPAETGFLISGGYVGQFIGAISLSGIAERRGRIPVLRWTIALFGLLSIACAFAFDFRSLFWIRLLQGIGLGAELPLAATYINEWTKAEYRGTLITLNQAIWAIGAVIAASVSVWVIPHLGWQWIFYIGAVPAFLALLLRRYVPESPRWLVSQGRLVEADRIVAEIEREASQDGKRMLPPVPTTIPAIARERTSWYSLFSRDYLGRTLVVWAVTFSTAFVGYGIVTWMPTLFRTVYHLPLQQTLNYGFVNTGMGTLGVLFGVALLDFIGRRPSFLIAFIGSGLPLLGIWLYADTLSAFELNLLASTARLFIGITQAGIYAYMTEIYPTRMRALASGIASSWFRIASIVGPSTVGLILGTHGIGAVFLTFAVIAVFGATITALFLIETRGRLLEEIAK